MLRSALCRFCAGTPAESNPSQPKYNAEKRVVIGSCRFVMVPVAVDFALRNQRSEVRILSGVFEEPPMSGSFLLAAECRNAWKPAARNALGKRSLSIAGYPSAYNFHMALAAVAWET